MGYIDAHFKRAFRLTLKDQEIADRALEGYPEPYRHLDTAVLEALLLKGPLGMTEDDITNAGPRVRPDDEEALELVASATSTPRSSCADPVSGCSEIAAAGDQHAAEDHVFLSQSSDRARVQSADYNSSQTTCPNISRSRPRMKGHRPPRERFTPHGQDPRHELAVDEPRARSGRHGPEPLELLAASAWPPVPR